jgi:hypothetical protein
LKYWDGRVAVDFGVGQGAKRSTDIRSDLGQASHAGQRQNQRNPGGCDPFPYFNSLVGPFWKYFAFAGISSGIRYDTQFCVFIAKIWSLLFGIPLVLDARSSYLPRILEEITPTDRSMTAQSGLEWKKAARAVYGKFLIPRAGGVAVSE